LMGTSEDEVLGAVGGREEEGGPVGAPGHSSTHNSRIGG
jgi:hypothetical protein